MGFLEKEIGHDYGQEEQRRTKEIGKKIRKPGKEPCAAKERRKVLCWLSKVSTNGSCLISIVNNNEERVW
jgi:hypothetical protein